jgi:hypothetical protein
LRVAARASIPMSAKDLPRMRFRIFMGLSMPSVDSIHTKQNQNGGREQVVRCGRM